MHQGLSLAALPVSVPCLIICDFGLPDFGFEEKLTGFDGLQIANRKSQIQNEPAPPMGFEPTVSTLTGWRALRAAPRGRSISDFGIAIVDLKKADQAGRARLQIQNQAIQNPK
jgi:hypothetical protein